MKTIATVLLSTLLLVAASTAGAQNVEYVNSILWTDVRDVEVTGNYAYCAFGNGLVVLDISDPAQPILVSRLCLQGDGAYGIDVDGNFAYLACTESGLRIIDISNPTQPVLIGDYDTPDWAYDVFVSGSYAYVADGPDGGLQILNISDPAQPQWVGEYDTLDVARDVFVSGSYAYVADGPNGGLQILDISDPAQPGWVGEFDTPGTASGVFVSGIYAYVADGTICLQIIDISDPAYPDWIGQYDTPGYSGAKDVCVLGNYAYLTDSWGLRIIDIGDPANPVEVGNYATISTWAVFLLNNYVYVTVVSGGLRIIDISDPYQPTLAGAFYTRNETWDIYMSGHYAYVACKYSGLQIFDISDPAEPGWVGEYPLSTFNVFVSGSYAYIPDVYDLEIVDISNPAAPSWVGECVMTSPGTAVFVAGDYAYVACNVGPFDYCMEWGGMQIIDISDPTQPVWVAEYYEDDISLFQSSGVFVSGDYAYLTGSWCQENWPECECSGALAIIDVSDPTQPTRVGEYDTPAADVIISGSYAYVAGGGSGLQVIDVSNPAQPTWVGEYDTPGSAADISLSDHYAYVADYTSGLQIIDVSDPSQPAWAGEYDTPGRAFAVFASDGYAYVVDEYSLMILRFDPETGIAEEAGTPAQFSLSQNYPNPLNPATTVNYDLPKSCDVTIEIYDVLGRKIQTLVCEKQQAGHHSVVWNADRNSSGVYFYRIKAGEYTETKKMLVLK